MWNMLFVKSFSEKWNKLLRFLRETKDPTTKSSKIKLFVILCLCFIQFSVKDEESGEMSCFSGSSSLVDQSLVGAKLLPGRNEILAFVRANSGDNSNDYLPGLCLFVERWLQHVLRF